jgi:hypothetical protein
MSMPSMPARPKSEDSIDKPRLSRPRSEAKSNLIEQIGKAEELKAKSITADAELAKAKGELSIFDSYNAEMLARLFDGDRYAREYMSVYQGPAALMVGPDYALPLTSRVKYFQEDVESRITVLQSILARLDLIPESFGPPSAAPPGDDRGRRDVFVIHGRDEAAKNAIAEFLRKVGLNPIILHEQPSQGRTVIEKLEKYSDTAYAVALLTPDDEGRPKTSPENTSANLIPRARQNVIFELGFLSGKLGRGRVCALLKGEVERPSDYDGVVYVPLDPNDGWKLKLATELKAAKMDADFSRLM